MLHQFRPSLHNTTEIFQGASGVDLACCEDSGLTIRILGPDGKTPMPADYLRCWLVYYTLPDLTGLPAALNIQMTDGSLVDAPLCYALQCMPLHRGISLNPHIGPETLEPLWDSPIPPGYLRFCIPLIPKIDEILAWLNESGCLFKFEDWLAFPRMFLPGWPAAIVEYKEYLRAHDPKHYAQYLRREEKNKLDKECREAQKNLAELDETWHEQRLAAITIRDRIERIIERIREIDDTEEQASTPAS